MKNQTLTIVINFKDGAEMGDALARAVDDLSNGCKERKGHSLSYWIRDDVALLREAEGYAMGEVLSDWDDSYTFEQVCAYLSDEYDEGAPEDADDDYEPPVTVWEAYECHAGQWVAQLLEDKRDQYLRMKKGD